jgi:hypothetical protein
MVARQVIQVFKAGAASVEIDLGLEMHTSYNLDHALCATCQILEMIERVVKD